MNKIELVQTIGSEVCEGCGPDEDCGINPSECSRVQNAVTSLDKYVEQLLRKARRENSYITI